VDSVATRTHAEEKKRQRSLVGGTAVSTSADAAEFAAATSSVRRGESRQTNKREGGNAKGESHEVFAGSAVSTKSVAVRRRKGSTHGTQPVRGKSEKLIARQQNKI
jgi:hypothetical protein